jgi:hypothetical protein
VELYNEHKAVLEGKLSQTITNLKKNDLWSKIADDVSSFGPDRTVEQCRKKIADSKSSTKAKAARIAFNQKLTSGGPKHTEELTPIESMIAAKLPKVTYEVLPILFETVAKKGCSLQTFHAKMNCVHKGFIKLNGLD